MNWALAAACAAATIPAAIRWLRVAQREHYLAPSVTRFALRWWWLGPANRVLLLAGAVGVAGTATGEVWPGFLVAAAQVGPLGLPMRGRTSPLAWTPRLRRLTGLVGGSLAVVYVAGASTGSPLLVVAPLFLLPLVVDGALALLRPMEHSLGDRWVAKARARVESSRAQIVAITGSYGKTTTKGYVAHLLAGSRRVVASPASYNNRMGLARAVNEHLVPGTEVFVAEMGTYGTGEIAELCSWLPPTVAALISVGPVHLERFKTLERVVAAKAEILDRADVGVISVDHPLLAALAAERDRRMEVMTVSGEGGEARFTVREGRLVIDGEEVFPLPRHVLPLNLAAAAAICHSLGVPTGELAARVEGLPRPAHRLTVELSELGFAIIDDTYNSNPAGARLALAALAASPGRKILVTPGMVELGPIQAEENRVLARLAAGMIDHIIVVGRTNRRALLEGAGGGAAAVTVVNTRVEAVDWVRANLGAGDTVLYENDLPDHYP